MMKVIRSTMLIKKISIIPALLIVSGCNISSNKDIVPFEIHNKVSSYHCWPYDVDVYPVSNIKIDSLFYSYPLGSYFGKNPKYKMTTWTRYGEIDTTVWRGMQSTLEQCDDNIELHNQILKGNDVYYSGIYRNFKALKGAEIRRYEKILFLDLANNRLHIFQDINKVF